MRSILPPGLIGLSFLLAGCAAAVPPNGAVPLFLVTQGEHTDIALAVRDLHEPLLVLARERPPATYLVVGFGDRAFMRSRAPGVLTTVGALFPDRASIVVTGLSAPPDAVFGATHVRQVDLTHQGMDGVEAFIWAAFAKDGQEGRLPAETGAVADSDYYPASAQYSALHTCNGWVAQALRAGGVRVQAWGVVFAGQLLAQLPATVFRVHVVDRPGGERDLR